MIQLDGLLRSINLQIALSRTTAGQAHSEVENWKLLLLRRPLVVPLRQRLKGGELVPHSQSG